MKLGLAPVLALVMTACSTNTVLDNASAADAAAPVADAEPAPVVETITWSSGPDLAIARDHHATFLVDPGGTAARFVYVAGGFAQEPAGLLGDVIRSPVADDGSLGPWQAAGNLPTAIAGAAVIPSQGVIVLAGGFQSKESWSAVVGADGSLGPWKQGPDLAGIRFHAVGVSYKQFVYVIGGIAGNVTVNDVARATLAPDGTLSPFEVVAQLPYSLSHEVAVVDGSRLYVIDGQTGNTNNNSGTPRKSTLVATLGDDGSVGAFQGGPDTPAAYETSSALLRNGTIRMFGGVIDPDGTEASGVPSTDVLAASVLGPGELGDWTVDVASKLPQAISHVHQAPVFGNHVYLVSGLSGAAGDQPAVRIGAFH